MNDGSTPTTCPNGHPFPESLGRHGIDSQGKPRIYCRACRPTRRIPPDPMAIERAVSGRPPAYLRVKERAAAVRRLDARGLTAKEIAARVGCSKRTVHRIRARNAA